MAELSTEDLFTSVRRFAFDLATSWPANSALGQLLRRALADGTVRAQLLQSPAESLAAAGVNVPEGIDVSVMETSPTQLHLVLPAEYRIKPALLALPGELKTNPIKLALIECCKDAALRKAMLNDPAGVLTSKGFEVPGGTSVRCHQNDGGRAHIVLPPLESEELQEQKRAVKLGPVADTPAELSLTWQEPTFLEVVGTVDSTTAGILRQQLDRILYDVDLDLSGVKFFSSQGIGMLVRTQKRLAAAGSRVRLLNVPEVLLNVLKIFRLLEIIEIEERMDGDLMKLYRFN